MADTQFWSIRSVAPNSCLFSGMSRMAAWNLCKGLLIKAELKGFIAPVGTASFATFFCLHKHSGNSTALSITPIQQVRIPVACVILPSCVEHVNLNDQKIKSFLSSLHEFPSLMFRAVGAVTMSWWWPNPTDSVLEGKRQLMGCEKILQAFEANPRVDSSFGRNASEVFVDVCSGGWTSVFIYWKHATEASEGMSDINKGFAFPKASRFLIRTSS